MIVRKIIISIFCLVVIQLTYAQKPIIDSQAIVNWPTLSANNVCISDDGNYFSYTVDKQLQGSMTVIQSADNRWRREISGSGRCIFSGDNSQAVLHKDDTLFWFKLGSENATCISGVIQFKTPEYGNRQWMAYTVKTPSNELVLRNLLSGKEQRLSNVVDFSFDKEGALLVYKTVQERNNISEESLQWLQLKTSKVLHIWPEPGSAGDRILGSFNLDDDGAQAAFIVKEKHGKVSNNTIWYYIVGMRTAVKKVDEKTDGIENGLFIPEISPSFLIRMVIIFGLS